MGNSQYIRKANKIINYIRFANILRTQRCYIRYANYTFKTTEGYYYQF